MKGFIYKQQIPLLDIAQEAQRMCGNSGHELEDKGDSIICISCGATWFRSAKIVESENEKHQVQLRTEQTT
jgi:hypothetical protein